MSTLELKLPPPALALCIAFFMWWSSFFVGPINVPLAYRLGLALAIATIGTCIDVVAKLAFVRLNTSVNPLRPETASVLASGGLYRFTRNPMYFGRALQLLGWATYLCNGIALGLVLFFVAYITRFQILPEERALSVRFGKEFAAYRMHVPRWV
ncbi:MAG: isoprenylcysteine carboxylmethyltransferase family protein [Dokdonella sp.]